MNDRKLFTRQETKRMRKERRKWEKTQVKIRGVFKKQIREENIDTINILQLLEAHQLLDKMDKNTILEGRYFWKDGKQYVIKEGKPIEIIYDSSLHNDDDNNEEL